MPNGYKYNKFISFLIKNIFFCVTYAIQQLFYQEKMIKYTPFIQNYVFILLLSPIENLFIY